MARRPLLINWPPSSGALPSAVTRSKRASTAPFNPEPGDALTQRTLPVFFDTLNLLLRAGVTVIADAAFQDRVWKSNLEPLNPLARIKVVQCRTEPATARKRMADRGFRTAHADQRFLPVTTISTTSCGSRCQYQPSTLTPATATSRRLNRSLAFSILADSRSDQTPVDDAVTATVAECCIGTPVD